MHILDHQGHQRTLHGAKRSLFIKNKHGVFQRSRRRSSGICSAAIKFPAPDQLKQSSKERLPTEEVVRTGYSKTVGEFMACTVLDYIETFVFEVGVARTPS
jgi:hypothetical protein